MASWWLPRPNGGVRRMATLSPRDAHAWNRLGAVVASAIEPRLDARVLANRSVVDGSRWRLAGHRPALGRARRAAAVLADRAAVLLRTDVAAFYPSVSPSALHRALFAAGLERTDARGAADMVEGWGSAGYPGLPIGPHASAVMANAVLREVDRALSGSKFLRWVDDYLIAAPSERAADEVLDKFDASLARLALCRNEAKTLMADGAGRLPWLGVSDVAITW